MGMKGRGRTEEDNRRSRTGGIKFILPALAALCLGASLSLAVVGGDMSGLASSGREKVAISVTGREPWSLRVPDVRSPTALFRRSTMIPSNTKRKLSRIRQVCRSEGGQGNTEQPNSLRHRELPPE